MDLCSHDEAAERVAASALTLTLVDVEPDDVADLLVGIGSLEGLGAPERAIVSAHWRTLAWAVDQGYRGEAEVQMEGIASALGLEHGICDWEQLFSVFPDPWFVPARWPSRSWLPSTVIGLPPRHYTVSRPVHGPDGDRCRILNGLGSSRGAERSAGSAAGSATFA